MAEFEPVDLDAIEDALDGLQQASDEELEALSASPAARARLQEYRDVMAAVDTHLPRVQVSASLNQSILEAAHREFSAQDGAIAAPAPTSVRDEQAPRSLWRRWMLPALSLVSSAAIVLLYVNAQPERLEAGDLESASEPSRAEAKASDARLDKEDTAATAPLAEMRPEGDAEMQAAEEREQPAPAALPADDGAAGAAAARQGNLGLGSAKEPGAKLETMGSGGLKRADGPTRSRRSVMNKKRRASKPSKSKKADMEALLDDDLVQETAEKAHSKPEAKSDSAATIASQLTSADRLRRQSRCDAARKLYRSVQAAKEASSRQKARAIAGLSLCEAAAGREDAAGKLGQAAIELDPDMGVWMEVEQRRLETTEE